MNSRTRLRASKLIFGLGLLLSIPAVAAAQVGGGGLAGNGSPVSMMLALSLLALAPFVIMMMTSFVKVSVVLSILRSALGTQNIPPNQVVTGLAFVLTIFIMTPTVARMIERAGLTGGGTAIFTDQTFRELLGGVDRAKEPLREFLLSNSHKTEINNFSAQWDARRISYLTQGKQVEGCLDPTSFQVLIPSFVVSQLKEAFLMGFLIYLPFLVLDMIVVNILMAMGMSMMQPATVSLPFKLLLFVMADGWTLVCRALVMSFNGGFR